MPTRLTWFGLPSLAAWQPFDFFCITLLQAHEQVFLIVSDASSVPTAMANHDS